MSRRFTRSILQQHLEEGAELWRTRRAWLGDPEIELADIAKLEQRQDAHVRGLFHGAELGRAVAREAVLEGDAAAVHVGARALALLDDRELLTLVLPRVAEEAAAGATPDAAEEPTLLEGLAEALAVSAPLRWISLFEPFVEEPAPGPALVRAAATRGLALGSHIVAVLEARLAAGEQESIDPALVEALRALGDTPALPCLQRLLEAKLERPLWTAVAVAGLVLADPRITGFLRGWAGVWAWSPKAAVLAGVGCAELDSLVVTPTLLQALAVAGVPTVLPVLLQTLANPALADDAAGGLLLMTGAVLLEDEVIDEGTDEEDAAVKPATRSRLSKDPARWQAWIDEQQLAASPHRLRLGRPLSPEATLVAVTMNALPPALRELLCDDLWIAGLRCPRPAGPAAALLGFVEARLGGGRSHG